METTSCWSVQEDDQQVAELHQQRVDVENQAVVQGDQLCPALRAGVCVCGGGVLGHGCGAVNPCDQQVKLKLLELCDVTSCPGLYHESQKLPEVSSSLQLGEFLNFLKYYTRSKYYTWMTHDLWVLYH